MFLVCLEIVEQILGHTIFKLRYKKRFSYYCMVAVLVKFSHIKFLVIIVFLWNTEEEGKVFSVQVSKVRGIEE